jgi:hypothetical protein
MSSPLRELSSACHSFADACQIVLGSRPMAGDWQANTSFVQALTSHEAAFLGSL